MTNHSEHPTALAKQRERDSYNQRVATIMAVTELMANAFTTRALPVLTKGA